MLAWLRRRLCGNLRPIAEFHLFDGDALVLSTEQMMSLDIMNRMRADLECRFPGVTVVLLGPGIKLEHVIHGPGPREK